jgi:hypothetical protein
MTEDDTPLSSLVGEVSAALAEIVEILQRGKDCNEEVAATLAEISEAMSAGGSAKAIADAIRALRLDARQEAPQVKVENKINVSPTPIESHNHITVQPAPAAQPVVQVIERAPSRDFEISGITYDSLSRITGAKVRAITKQAA